MRRDIKAYVAFAKLPCFCSLLFFYNIFLDTFSCRFQRISICKIFRVG